MSGGKGGSQTSQVEIPAYLENASKKSLNRAEATQNIGYMPYMGPDVAAFTQPQQQAMQSNIDAAAAFGLVDPGLDAMAGMPQAQDFSGVQGYSSFPMYQMAVDDLKASRPGQVAAYDDLYVDPTTGQGGHNNGYPSFPGFDPGQLPPFGPLSPNVQGHSSDIGNHLDDVDPFGDLSNPPAAVGGTPQHMVHGPQNIINSQHGLGGAFEARQDDFIDTYALQQQLPTPQLSAPQLNNQDLQQMALSQGMNNQLSAPQFNQGLDMSMVNRLGSKLS